MAASSAAPGEKAGRRLAGFWLVPQLTTAALLCVMWLLPGGTPDEHAEQHRITV